MEWINHPSVVSNFVERRDLHLDLANLGLTSDQRKAVTFTGNREYQNLIFLSSVADHRVEFHLRVGLLQVLELSGKQKHVFYALRSQLVDHLLGQGSLDLKQVPVLDKEDASNVQRHQAYIWLATMHTPLVNTWPALVEMFAATNRSTVLEMAWAMADRVSTDPIESFTRLQRPVAGKDLGEVKKIIGDFKATNSYTTHVTGYWIGDLAVLRVAKIWEDRAVEYRMLITEAVRRELE